MPYRRLPNTDQARLRALRTAIQMGEKQSYDKQVVSFKAIHEAQTFLNIFEKQMQLYKQTLESQVNANKQYQQILYNARMYISHFIQVFNLSVIRGEIKKEHKLYYHLNPDTHQVPDLSTETAIQEWGKNIISGENERIRNGGTPVYNPTIAKVQVHFEVFNEYKSTQRIYQSTTTHNWEELVNQRKKADTIILDIWNQVEEHYRNEKPYAKLMKCKKFGLVYYYRRHEKELTPDNDL